MNETDELVNHLSLSYRDPDYFNAVILQRPPYWSGTSRGVAGQREWAEAIASHRTVVVESGNALGKDYLIGGLVPWWLWTRPDSLVILTGPSQTLLGSVTWKEVRRSIERCPWAPAFPEVFNCDLSQGIKTSPQTVLLEAGWQALAYSTTSIERASGQHAEHLLILVTEASGIDEEIGHALDSLKAEKMALFMNPIRPDGWAVEYADQGDRDERDGVPAREAVRHFVVPSTASPDADAEHSPHGLADRTWLDAMARRYGKDSLWYRSHVLAIRPKLSHERLLPPEWLDRAISEDAARAATVLRRDGKGGRRRISCDVGEGVGNARSVVAVRDDCGFLEIRADVFQGPVDTAAAIAELAHRYQVAEADISYDGAGTTGKRLGNALSGKGLPNARPYFGSGSGGKRFANLRSACAAAFARRLDPDHYVDAHRKQSAPFHIPNGPHLPALLEELKELRGQLKGDKYALEDKQDLMERLGRSPDFADCLTQAFREEAIKG